MENINLHYQKRSFKLSTLPQHFIKLWISYIYKFTQSFKIK